MKRAIVLVSLVLAFALPAAAQDVATHVACSAAQAVTAAADMLHIEAGTDRTVYVQKIWIIPGTQTAAGFHQIVLRRTTSASTGGSTVTPAPVNPLSQAFTGVVRYGATGGGTDGVTLLSAAYFVPTATTSGPENQFVVFDAQLARGVPLAIVKGGSTGLELRNSTGGAGGANHYACALFTEDTK